VGQIQPVQGLAPVAHTCGHCSESLAVLKAQNVNNTSSSQTFRISWLGKQLSASKGGLLCMELAGLCDDDWISVVYFRALIIS
jgi:hypothetical protein